MLVAVKAENAIEPVHIRPSAREFVYLAALALAFFCIAANVSAALLGIMVPAYFYPGPLWTSLNSAAARVPLTAIMNANNGPGAAQDANYVAAVNSLRAVGGKVTGYVYTSYGTRPLAQVEADIDRYLAWYSVDGFFVDEMTNDAAASHLDYYAALEQYIKGKGANLTVTCNPGTNTVEDYLTRKTADTLVIFENGSGYPAFTPSGWVTAHLARQFVHLVYDISTAATMKSDIDLAVSRNAGWVYVTNDNGANPWDTLPAYWENEVSYIDALNQGLPKTQLKMTGFSNRIPSLQITGAPGTYEIQATTDLSNWLSVATVSSPDGTATFSDTSAVNFTSRFYRAAQ